MKNIFIYQLKCATRLSMEMANPTWLNQFFNQAHWVSVSALYYEIVTVA